MPRRILFGCHEPSRTGAPILLLNFLRWLRAHTDYEIQVVLLRDGDLVDDFIDAATTSYLYTADRALVPLDSLSADRLGRRSRLGRRVGYPA